MLRVQELGKKLVKAGRLKLYPLCVCGTDEIPNGAMPLYIIDRSIAKVVDTATLFYDHGHPHISWAADGHGLRRIFHL